MKAVIVKQHGNADTLTFTDFETPLLEDDDVLVRVRATSVNRADLVIRNGYPGLTIPLPHILGGDIAGTIVSTGSAVKEWQPGDRVVVYPIVMDGGYTGDEYYTVGWQHYGMHRKGGYAEFVAVPQQNLIRLPEQVDYAEAATLPVAGLTALHALNVGGVAEGKTFFFWGGSGGMGTFLIQLAKKRGATVITTTGSPEKRALLESLGADYVFNHRTDDVTAEVMKIAPRGIDTVLDYVGPATSQQSFAMLTRGGKIMWCGMLTGREVTLNIQLTYLKHASIHGLYLGSLSEMRQLAGYLGEGWLKPHIHTILPLNEAAKAHRIIESKEYSGKIVLEP